MADSTIVFTWNPAWLTKRELVALFATKRNRRIDLRDASRLQRYLRGDRSAASYDKLTSWVAQLVDEIEIVEREANARSFTLKVV